MSGIKAFYLDREEDVSGVSGTGRVAEGIEFSNGKVVVHWPSDSPSTNHYENMKQMLKVHGHGGKLKVVKLFEEDDPDSEENATVDGNRTPDRTDEAERPDSSEGS